MANVYEASDPVCHRPGFAAWLRRSGINPHAAYRLVVDGHHGLVYEFKLNKKRKPYYDRARNDVARRQPRAVRLADRPLVSGPSR